MGRQAGLGPPTCRPLDPTTRERRRARSLLAAPGEPVQTENGRRPEPRQGTRPPPVIETMNGTAIETQVRHRSFWFSMDEVTALFVGASAIALLAAVLPPAARAAGLAQVVQLPELGDKAITGLGVAIALILGGYAKFRDMRLNADVKEAAAKVWRHEKRNLEQVIAGLKQDNAWKDERLEHADAEIERLTKRLDIVGDENRRLHEQIRLQWERERGHDRGAT